ncbi:UAA-domain-containing protein [Gonapodya prolifera JEL478]|uniref:UDP-galactose transporter homolog 1 n=1 Tax=Gonapodya prolifera (strain JEL478) TaxID=1344416 RepID=A0A139AGP6_GONPJ|nr:UAA-domain-containing protein [Gonapodya prolifera JEL478]|eukprot:KXS15918.1 UAA-domain-containing protein [Gonapodya prolifera JEL478]
MAGTSRSDLTLLVFCVGGIYVFFLTWGLLQERVSTTPYVDPKEPDAPPRKFQYFVFLNMIQSIAASVCAFISIRARGSQLGTPRGTLATLYARAATLNSIASPLGYTSLKHIDYPTMLLGKSCKLVPVMLVGWVLYRRTYPWYKIVGVILITVGVSIFMLLHEHSGSHSAKDGSQGNSFYGLLLLSTNLVIDGVTNSTQDHIFREHRATSQQMMLWMNVFAAPMMFAWIIITEPWSGELRGALSFLLTHSRCAMDVAMFAICGAIGQLFIFYTLSIFGSIVLVTVTVTRKMLSIILSVFWFGHHLTLFQWFAVGVVFLGVTFEDLAARLRWDALLRRYLSKASPRVAALLGLEIRKSKSYSGYNSDASGDENILPGGAQNRVKSGFGRLRTRQREEMSAVANGSLGELMRTR